MKREQYLAYLEDPRWKETRIRILKRDKFICRDCGCDVCKPLQVHHLLYLLDQPPWAVPDQYLISLCLGCHEKRHEEAPGWTLVVYDLLKKEPVYPLKKQKKPGSPKKRYKPKKK